MCGIIGYIGNKEATPLILEGLKKLEYRGYDSAGIAVLEGSSLKVHKERGKISTLIASFDGNRFKARIGIGHTRWATHGEPSKVNAHPHLDCQERIAVVHNGIVENYQSLREKLYSKSHRFRSDTDTEVIAHLIEDHLQRGKKLLEAVYASLKELQGTYALVIMCKDFPDRLIVARNGSPLILGIKEKEKFVASDIPALLKYTNEVIVLDDYQVAELTLDRLRITDLKGREYPARSMRVNWTLEETEKESFSHFMLKEIHEQPKRIEALLNCYVNWKTLDINFNTASSFFNFSKRELKKVDRILIQACGTSFHAGLLGRYLLNLFSHILCDVQISSEFRYQPLVTSKNTLVLSITQSGETTDTLMGLRLTKLRRLKTLSICNVVGSSIARESDSVIYTHAGPEIGVASTKAYTAQMLVLYLLAIHLGEIRGQITPHFKERLLLTLKKVPRLMAEILKSEGEIRECAKRYSQIKDFLFLGRSLNYPNALEGALKLKEIAYVHASGHPAGEMKHGPIALIDQNVGVVAIAPFDDVYEKMFSNIEEVKARKGKVIAICSQGNTELKTHCNEVFYVPEIDEHFYPLLIALPLQLFAYYVALDRGCEIDQPRNLAKSVTVE